MNTHDDDPFISELLQRCDFSRDSAAHRASLRKKLLAQRFELTEDELDFVAAAGDTDALCQRKEGKDVLPGGPE